MWYLVVSSCWLIYLAQLRFLVHRFNWLKHIPPPRATTLLVENLPKECRSDDALRVYFARLFGPQSIVQAYVVRRTERLRKLFTDVETTASRLHLEEVRQPGRECPCGSEVDKGLLRSTLVDLKAEVSKAQKKVEEAVQQMDLKVCSSAGFVTFTSRRMCMLALSPQYRADASQFTTTMPPDPEDVIYQDLAKDPEVRAGGVLTAGALLLLIFIIWAPMIATFLDKVEPFIVSVQNPQARHLLQGVMRTGVLKMFMSCLPTLFMAIIHNFLTLKAGAWAQLKLQDWFFAFQLVFILLVTTIVGTVLNVLEKLLAHPGEVVYILADALPGFSNFYINYILLSCFLQVFDLLRTMNLAKYLFWRGRNADPDEARDLSEPEDQDSDGMGSRMAKVAIHLVVCTVFASCCPVILLVAWLYFALGRYTYGFLVIFAETKKPDMGGAFWVKSLRHLFLGVLIYILLMVGLLSRTSPDREPMLCAFASILALGFGYLRFSSLSWEALPFEAVAEVDLQHREVSGEYRQPECGRPREGRRESVGKKVLGQGDIVFEAGEECTHIYFLSAGLVLEYTPLAHRSKKLEDAPSHRLQQKQWLSEPSLWVPWKHLGVCEAEKPGELISVDANSFCKEMSAHPAPRTFCASYARLYVECLNNLPKQVLSDVLDQHILDSTALVERASVLLAAIYENRAASNLDLTNVG